MANRIVGLKNIHIAKKTGPGAYDAPKRLEGAKTFNTTNEVSETSFYSDDVMDHYFKSATSMDIEIELAYLTPEMESLIMGKTLVNGALVSSTEDVANEFAIIYELTTLKEPIRRVIYDCTLSKDDLNSATKADSVEEQLVTLTGKAKAGTDGVFDAVLDKNNPPTDPDELRKFEAIFNDFFTKVYTKDEIERQP